MMPKQRFILALVIMLSGLLLVPFVALPREGFRWQIFAGVYNVGPQIDCNYDDGGPGSFFLISGHGFTPGKTLTVRSNGKAFATVTVGSDGTFKFLISTGTGADKAGLGQYAISVDDSTPTTAATLAESALTSFVLRAGAPVRAAPAGAPAAVQLPNNPAGLKVWLPFTTK